MQVQRESALADSADWVGCLTYQSRAIARPAPGELEQLVAGARKRNRSLGVTGMLLYDNGRFLQTLEGPPLVAFRGDCCRIGIADGGVHSVTATVQDAVRTGSIVRYLLKSENGDAFRVEHPAQAHVLSQVGDAVTVNIPRQSVRSFD